MSERAPLEALFNLLSRCHIALISSRYCPLTHLYTRDISCVRGSHNHSVFPLLLIIIIIFYYYYYYYYCCLVNFDNSMGTGKFPSLTLNSEFALCSKTKQISAQFSLHCNAIVRKNSWAGLLSDSLFLSSTRIIY
jgi:hypothetical protein